MAILWAMVLKIIGEAEKTRGKIVSRGDIKIGTLEECCRHPCPQHWGLLVPMVAVNCRLSPLTRTIVDSICYKLH